MDLVSHRFISYFDAPEAQQLCDLAVVEKFTDQSIIFEEGEDPSFLYLVLEGQVEFKKQASFNQYQTVAVAKANDFFGEFGVLDGQPRSARAMAAGKIKLAKISRPHLMEILSNAKGKVILNLFSYIIHHLRVTTNQYVNQLVRKEKMELVGEMVNTILHDFRSPFTGIQLSSAMLKEMHPDEETEEWCDLISMQIQRMLGMAEEVLEFAKGSTVLYRRPVYVAKMLEHFEKLNRVYFQSTQVEFSVNADDDCIIYVDENKLIRVFQNLVGNAVEAFEKPGGKIVITTSKTPGWVTIAIADNGPGIPEAIREHLFDAFVTYGKRSGTGLGTAIAKSIIDAHGGKIEFKSIAHEGTTFYILLPETQPQEMLEEVAEEVKLN
ncbi:ATP-binding protein [Planktothrix mougeotii]|uniref:histidine kinase n=1 Tax=Planktothrix mougeotii LEGE 06226 TaxID=1828728 RepID=A0ABR9UG98_9CYAN|nr:ATP-binding protein [Planktothrix mougeotii]MBE9145492.1 cyclic nucleotide-binding domain-containing protein [Planktothrix mougeotii LEGE 06226]